LAVRLKKMVFLTLAFHSDSFFLALSPLTTKTDARGTL
jgi:hypothetical protein